MKFILPIPPSINQTYAVSRTGNHPLYKKKFVKDWEKEAGWELKKQWRKQGFKPFPGSVQVGIRWFYKINRDVDAGIKVLLDLFQRQQVVANDRQIRKITHIDIEPDFSNPRVEVEIDEMA